MYWDPCCFWKKKHMYDKEMSIQPPSWLKYLCGHMEAGIPLQQQLKQRTLPSSANTIKNCFRHHYTMSVYVQSTPVWLCWLDSICLSAISLSLNVHKWKTFFSFHERWPLLVSMQQQMDCWIWKCVKCCLKCLDSVLKCQRVSCWAGPRLLQTQGQLVL